MADGLMHENTSMMAGLLGLIALAAIAIYFLFHFFASTILATVPRS